MTTFNYIYSIIINFSIINAHKTIKLIFCWVLDIL